MTIVFRRPDASDPIADLHTRSRQDAYRGLYGDNYLDRELFDISRDQWRERFASCDPASDHLIAAMRQGQPLGFAYASFRLKPEIGALLDNLHVAPEARGAGLGTQLLAQVALWLVTEHAASPLHLEVYAPNTAALALYARLGGDVVDSYDEVAPGGRHVEVLRLRWNDPSALATLATSPARTA